MIRIEADNRGVVKFILNRPEVKNAFNAELIKKIHEAIKRYGKKARVIVVEGEGDVFCAGGDLQWMKEATQLSAAANYQDTLKLSKMFEAFFEVPCPVIGVVQGAAIGGGVGLVSICDYVIASQETQFSLSEVRLGLIPACIGPFVISKIGASFARAYFLSAKRFGATEAYHMGLIHQIVSKQDLATERDRIVQNILECSPQALRVAKEMILNLSVPEKRTRYSKKIIPYISKTLAHLRVSREGQEGVRAFLEKRKPQWPNS